MLPACFSLLSNSRPKAWREFTKARHDGLCEYISRAARAELVSMLVRGVGSTRGLAKRIGVSHVAVLRWMRTGYVHPSNVNLRKIVELAVESDGPAMYKILERDLRMHQISLKKFMADIKW